MNMDGHEETNAGTVAPITGNGVITYREPFERSLVGLLTSQKRELDLNSPDGFSKYPNSSPVSTPTVEALK